MQHFVLIAVFQRLAKAKKPKIPTPERQNFNCRELSRLGDGASVARFQHFPFSLRFLVLTAPILHVLECVYMQDTKRQERLSRLRGALLALLERLRETLEVALARTPLVKGTVYQIARRCGTPNCSCTRGQLHRNMVLTWSDEGRHRMRSIPPAQLADLRKKSAEYLRFRRARAEVAVLHKKILKVLDQIQELRREEP
jgi:hypothetical protein